MERESKQERDLPMKNKTKLIIAALLVLAIAVPVLANVVREGYTELLSEPGVFHTATNASPDDGDTDSGPAAYLESRGNTAAWIEPLFSDSGATATIKVTYHVSSTGRGIVADVTTATATSTVALKTTVDGTDYFPTTAGALGYSTRGMPIVGVEILNVSAGTCALTGAAYGHTPSVGQ